MDHWKSKTNPLLFPQTKFPLSNTILITSGSLGTRGVSMNYISETKSQPRESILLGVLLTPRFTRRISIPGMRLEVGILDGAG